MKYLKLPLSLCVMLALVCLAPGCCGSPPEVTEVGYSVDGGGVMISWSTDEDSTSQVEYGPTTDYGNTTDIDTVLKADHLVALNGLDSFTTYHYRVRSKNVSGEETVSSDYTFTTDGVEISNAGLSGVSAYGAVITWDTDVEATSQVEYGPTTAYGSVSALDSTMSTSHRIGITGLAEKTAYHFRVKSKSISGFETCSSDYTFTTLDFSQIVAGFTGGPSTLNPFWAQRYPQTAFLGMIMEPLVYVNEDGSIDPCLASSWSQSTDGLEWTFNIDPDATFSDGEPVTADDVVFTFNTHWEHIGEWSQARNNMALLEEATSETPSTISLTFEHNDTTADRIKRWSGSFIDDGWQAGEMVRVSGTPDGSDDGDSGENDGVYKIAEVYGEYLVLEDGYELTQQGMQAGATLTATGPDADALVKVDEGTVVFKMNDTYNSAVFLPTLGTVFICPQHIWAPKIDELIDDGQSIELYALEEEDAATISEMLIGSGPFLFDEYVVEQHMTYKTNPNYWQGELAKVTEVMFKIYADPDPATLALTNGEVDCLAIVESPASVTALLMEQDITVDITDNYNGNTMFYLNMRHPPLHILEVRQAIDMALDKDAIITEAASGYGTSPQMIPYAPGLSESNNDISWMNQYVDNSGDFLPLADRIENANALLDSIPGMSQTPLAVDVGGGVMQIPAFTRTWTSPDYPSLEFELSWEALYLSSPVYQRAANLIADQMAEIGIKITPYIDTSG